MDCPVCTKRMNHHANVRVMGCHDTSLNLCPHCGLLAMPEPYWLEEAYNNVINLTDTGLMYRNIVFSQQLSVFLYFAFGERGEGQYLDMAGGYGVFVRLMRDIGFNFFWEDIYAKNLVARGFEWDEKSQASSVAVTAFEVLEHVPNPVEFLKSALDKANSDTIIFSTTLYGDTPPDLDGWEYYSFETGQHISFYQTRTMERMAAELGATYYGNGSMHIITRRKAPLSRILIKICFSRLRWLLYPWVRRQLNGLTLSDSRAMIKRLNDRFRAEKK